MCGQCAVSYRPEFYYPPICILFFSYIYYLVLVCFLHFSWTGFGIQFFVLGVIHCCLFVCYTIFLLCDIYFKSNYLHTLFLVKRVMFYTIYRTWNAIFTYIWCAVHTVILSCIKVYYVIQCTSIYTVYL